ncbi:hypothetical protein GL263_06655 [Streptomyces durbertensis]|uniref:Membrane protein SCJ1.26 n=1 Tax=Streptomyces durbertensis TaxID=2448886 RepID=A0ABR6ED38_9ACTN|nr:hypothetical protein [Streptomyces durbertensis]MBB1243245.1 hypothetical protein [Streptomyces durbertensis]
MFRAVAGLWRWRRNPLCRRTDRAEGWLALTALLCVVLGAPAAGLAAEQGAERALAATARHQHEDRRQVVATVVRVLPGGGGGRTDPADDPRADQRVLTVWSAPDGRLRRAAVTLAHRARAGDRVRLWVDSTGRVTTPPLDGATVASTAAAAGTVVAVAAAAAVETVRRLVLGVMLRRRWERWESEWSRAGPGWGRPRPSAAPN